MTLRHLLGKIKRNTIDFYRGDSVVLCRFKLRHLIQNRGKNPDKTFYVIWWNAEASIGTGLFVHIKYVISQIEYALLQGYIPVVDMRGVYNNYTSRRNENAWELLFEQPCNYTLREVYSSKNVVFSDGTARDDLMPNLGYGFNWNDFYSKRENSTDKTKAEHFRLLFQNYLKLNKEMKTKLDKNYSTLFQENVSGCDTLGLRIRGTDYIAMKPSNHPVQPSGEEIIDALEKICNEFGYKNVFVGTEDESLFQIVKKWGELKGINVFDNPSDIRKNYQGGWILQNIQNNHLNFLEEQKNYLINMMLLTKCGAFVGGKTSASRFIPLMGNFDYIYFFELGLYR